MLLLYIAFAIASIGLIIFIHEAGHFLAAKKVGCRVEAFALGFDPPFRGRRLRFGSFRRGDTEYILGMIPFGGYVKLAGETAMEVGTRPPAPDELLAQPVGARALIFAAGALMNIASAFLFFMIAFAIGVSFTQPQVGTVTPGSPAWEAGILPGDTIAAIDAKPITEFYEIVMASALAGQDETLELELRRSSAATGPVEIVKRVSPRWDPEMGIHALGISAALDPVLDAPPAGSAAHKAGLREGDRIVGARIAGEELPPLAPAVLVTAIVEGLNYGGGGLELQVQRGPETLWLRLEPEREPDATPKLMVIGTGGGTVAKGIAPDSTAAAFFSPGDRVLAVGGAPAGSMHWLALATRFRGSPRLELELAGRDGKVRKVQIDRQALLEIALTGTVDWRDHQARVGELRDGSPLASFLEEGDTITAADETAIYTPSDLARAAAAALGPTVRLQVLRQGTLRSISVAVEFIRDHGIRWRSFPRLAWVTADGPAARAGIEAGSIITQLGSASIFAWSDLVEALQEREAGDEAAVAWIDPAGAERRGVVKLDYRPYAPVELPVEPLSHVIRTGLAESIALGFQRTVVNIQRVFLTLRSLLLREVSAKNLTGPLGITHLFTRVAEFGLGKLIYFIAIVSVNLGLLNLLPIPILDGGHLFFLLIEKIKGSPVNIRIQEWATSIALVLILSLALFVTFQDVRRLFGSF